jgi:hypothetical protein
MRDGVALAIGILLLFISDLPAQEVGGRLEGRVLDQQGQPIGGVQVVVTGPSLQGIREAKADERGYFRFFSLPTGTFLVKLHHEAFLDIALDGVRVRLGATTSLGEIRLQQKVLEAHEIVVTAERPALDLTSTATGSNIVADTVKDLPVARDYRSIMALLPGANRSYYGDEVNVSGATGSENTYFIDGIDVSDPYMRLSSTSLPYNFIKELEVKTGGYEAEYRSSLGGLVNAVTYSGGNAFSGQIFGFYTNNNFSQSAVHSELEPSQGKFAQYDFGFSLGGPIVRDKIWFFGAYNPTVAREDVLIPGLGYYEDKLTRNIFAGKITWQPSAKANIVLTALGDPARHSAVGRAAITQALNPDPLLTTETEGGYNFLASGNYIFSDKFFLEASVSYIDRRDRSDPATERGRSEIWYIDQLTAVYSGGNWGEAYGDSQQATVSCKTTFMLGAHILKAGFEYRDNRLDSHTDQNVLNYFGDWYGLMTHNASGTVRNRIPSLFIQDSWRIGNRLRLNLGLRWSGEFWIASNEKIAQKITDEYQPRLGFIFEPSSNGSSKIFGSYGRFYQEISTLLLTWYQLQGSHFSMLTYDHDPRVDPSGGVILVESSGQIQEEIKGLRGQNYDELVLGYAQTINRNYGFRVQGIYRDFRDGIEDGLASNGQVFCANPGRPPLEDFSRMKRQYYGLELTFMKLNGRNFDYQVSYTLSRSYGNYPGLFAQDLGDYRPNISGQFDIPEDLINATGLLPNDRTHVFKVFGSYEFPFGLSVGSFFTWQSGTPLSEIGSQTVYPGFPMYLTQRGTAGRTPSLADFNLRVVYQLRNASGKKIAPRVVLDLFHIGSQRKPLTYNETHYFNVDESGNQTDPNPLYMHPTSYFPPMSARLGLEINF